MLLVPFKYYCNYCSITAKLVLYNQTFSRFAEKRAWSITAYPVSLIGKSAKCHIGLSVRHVTSPAPGAVGCYWWSRLSSLTLGHLCTIQLLHQEVLAFVCVCGLHQQALHVCASVFSVIKQIVLTRNDVTALIVGNSGSWTAAHPK